MVARHSAVMAVLAAMVLPATTGNNSPASGEYETIISEITGFTQVKHFYVHFVEKMTIIKSKEMFFKCLGLRWRDLGSLEHMLT